MKGWRTIVDLWRRQEGKYFCISTKEPWRDEFFARDEFDEVEDHVRDQMKAGRDCYFCAHGFTRPRRKKEFAVPPRLLFADLDEVDPAEIAWRPTIAIESSPGRFIGLWSLDKIASEELNKRMTYAVGADRGGWDWTQVLRFPGTRNYKYPTEPRVRVLWIDGPRYRVRDLEGQLPKISSSPQGSAEFGDIEIDPNWRAILRKYNLAVKLYVYVARELERRSEKVFKLARELVEAGADFNEVASVVWASKNFQSKFGKRADPLVELRREVESAWRAAHDT